ncbi:hypothetical protein [Flavobacterium johnsoniae]|uniref:Uncharacterized protein n=1 Tax=Flavobacterium johnsoniae TaxID=986 RepID=A0A1J7BSX5_FLAJO|nr:hypothetical protein [Flavobacterium johnsoniae]OIV41701.1 hypothetical protein BKM63_14390 [Flavobacterium johnsoniae]
MRKDIEDAMRKMLEIEAKFKNNQQLGIEELDRLGLLYSIDKNSEALKDSRFDDYKFYHLYLTYATDLTFKSTYYKRNENKRISETVDYREIQALNNQEFDSSISEKLHQFRIENQFITPVEKAEINNDKIFLENFAMNWAKTCLGDRHSEESHQIISKETRDTLAKKNIELYIENKLDSGQKLDVFKGLLKSYYIFHEAKKILEHIASHNQIKEFTLNEKTIELNLYSLVHILNRHYAELISSQSISTSRSFHNTKVEPTKINLFIDYLFSRIREKGLESVIEIKSNEAILFNYFGKDYAIFPREYKYNKSKIIIETFFIIESKNVNAKRLTEKIKNAEVFNLDENLKIYI